MKPPALAQALLAAAAPSCDYEIVAGDLHEEYLRIRYSSGAEAADRWYWTQTLLSLPSLLSYSRSNRSALRQVGVALIALAVLVAMLVVTVVIDTLFRGISHYAMGFMYDVDALAFGAILAWLVRSDGLRVTFWASTFLVLCFVVPAFAGHPGSQAPLLAWIRLLAVVPVMCLGAALYQIFRRRVANSH